MSAIKKVQAFASGGDAMKALAALCRSGKIPIPADDKEASGILAPFLIASRIVDAPGSFDLHKAMSDYNEAKPVPQHFSQQNILASRRRVVAIANPRKIS